MAKTFSVNTNRFDPYKNYRFCVFFGESTQPVAAVSKVSGLKRTSDVIEYREGRQSDCAQGAGSHQVRPSDPGARRDLRQRVRGVGRTRLRCWIREQPISHWRICAATCASNCSMKLGSSFTSTAYTAAGFRSSRRCPISMREGMPLPSSTLSSKTRAGNIRAKRNSSKFERNEDLFRMHPCINCPSATLT